MLNSIFTDNMTVVASNMIQKEPWLIVEIICSFLGAILNFIFNIVVSITTVNSLGFSIIILTIISRFIMLPLALKQHESMVAMKKLQPEIDKIKKKYADKKTQENQQKMNSEIQKLYSKNKINPLGGCLPLLIQMPIFIALNYIMRNIYLYVDKVGYIYESLANEIYGLFVTYGKDAYDAVINPLFIPHISKNVEDFYTAGIPDIQRAINTFSDQEWQTLLSQIPVSSQEIMMPLLQQKSTLEHFFGLNLTDVAGLSWPGVIIPILAVVTTFLSSYIMTRSNKSEDPNAKMQQKIMLIFMPIMMGWMTINLTIGVGLYWITSSVFQLLQQICLDKYYYSRVKIVGDDSAGGKNVKQIASKDVTKNANKGSNKKK